MGTESSKWLYDQLTKRGYNVGKDQAEFDSLMSSNDESRRWAFETARKSGLNVGADYDEFSSLVVGGGGAAPHADATPAARVNLNRFSLAPKEMRDALRAGDGHADIIGRSRPINSTSGSGVSEGSDGSEGLMSGDAVTSDSKQGEQAQGNWQPTMQQRIAMAHDFNMMTAQGEAAMNNIGENSKRSFERFTPEGRRRQELARMKAVTHGIDPRLVGAVPEAPRKKDFRTNAEAGTDYFHIRRGGKNLLVPVDEVNLYGGLQGWADAHPGAPVRVYMEGDGFSGHVDLKEAHKRLAQKGYKYRITHYSDPEKEDAAGGSNTDEGGYAPTGVSPTLYDVVTDEDGKKVAQWLMPDGSLSTSRYDASIAEGLAQQGRERMRFEQRMKGSGLDPKNPEDVKKQQLADNILLLESEQKKIGEQLDERKKELDGDDATFAEKHPVLNFFRELAQEGHNDASHMANKMGQATGDRYRTDMKYRTLNAAYMQNKETLQMLYDARDGKTNSFWHSAGNALNRGALSNGDFAFDRAIGRRWSIENQTDDSAQKFLKSDVKNEEISTSYGDQYGAWGRAGDMFVSSLDFMKDMLLLGGGPLSIAKGTAAATTRVGTRLLGKTAEKAVSKYALKATGTFLGSLAGGAVTANTTGLTRTAADISDRISGKAIETRNGRYDVKGGEGLAEAIWNAEREASVENATELVGGMIPGGIITKGLEKLGLKKVTQFFGSIQSKGWYKGYNKVAEMAGFNGLGSEILEEYAGMVYNTILGDGANQIEAFKNLDTHIDILLGCATTGMILNVPNIIGTGFEAREYYKHKKDLKKAEASAQKVFGNKWDGLMQKLDNFENEKISSGIAQILKSGKDMDSRQIKALLDYAVSLQQFRGFNLGMISMQDETQSLGNNLSSDMNNLYHAGHGVAYSPEEIVRIQNEYETQRQKLVNEFGSVGTELIDQIMEEVDNNPMEALQKAQDPGIRKAIENYAKAKSLRDGMLSGYSSESPESAMAAEAAEVQVDERAHRDSGEIIEATLKVGDRKVYILKGDVVMNADGVGVDTRASSDMVRVRDAETGEEFFISPDRIASVSEPVAVSSDAVEMPAEQSMGVADSGVSVENMSEEFRQGYAMGLDTQDMTDEELADSIAEFEGIRDNTEDGLSERGFGILDGLKAERERRAGVATQMQGEEGVLSDEGEIDSETDVEDAEIFVTSQYGNRSEQNNDGLAEREDRGRVAGDTAGSVEADRDRSDIRVYEEGLGTSSLTHSEYSERTRRNAESERLVGLTEPAGSADISTENEVSDAENASETASTVGNGEESALSRIPVDEVSGEPMFEAVDAETGWLGLLEAAQSDSERAGNIASKQADQARGELEALERKPPVRKNVKLKGSPMAMLKAEEEADRAYEKAVMEHAQKIEDAKSRYAAWREIVKVKTERERIEREERQRQAEAEEEARIMENRERLRREAEEREAAQSALKEQHEQAQRMAIEQLEDEERQRLQEESRAENVEKRLAFNNYEEAMDAERRAIIANHGEGLRSELAGRIQEARGGKAYGQIYGALDGDGVATLEEWVARNLSLGGRRVQWNGHGNLGGQIFGSSEGDKVSERRQYGWMTSDSGESFYEFVHKMWETLMGDKSVQFNRADVTDMDVRNMVIDLLRNHPTSRGLFEHAIDLYDSRTMSEGARDPLAEMEHYEKEIRDDWYNKNYGLSFDDYEARVENIYEELSRSKLSDEDAYEIASMIADEQAAMNNNNITEYETGNDGARQSSSEILHGQQTDWGQRDGTVAAGESASVVGRGDSSGRGVSTPSEGGLDSRDSGRDSQRTGNLSEEEIAITAPLSQTERDEFGKPFVISSDGTTAFGRIGAESGLTEATIQLSLGENHRDANGKNRGYGLLHIEAGHGEQIRNAGFSSVEEFVESVAKNYEVIREGNHYGNKQSYLLEVSDGHNNTLFVQLSNDGTYWNVNSAGIFRERYSRRKPIVTSLPTIGSNSSAETAEVNHGQNRGATVTSGNSSVTYANKGNALTGDKQVFDKDSSIQSAVEAASAEVNPEPSEAQKAAGNYKMEHRRIDGYNISIENPKGSVRRGKDADGKEWQTEMHHDYGYIRGTQGVDGDHIDVFLSDAPEEGDVFVVDQYNTDGSFDEHKVMYGFGSEKEAREAYLSNYSDGWENGRRLDITHVSKDEFKKWVQSSKRKTKPFADYRSVRDITINVDQSPTNVNEMGMIVDAEDKPLTLYHGTPNDVELSELEMGHTRAGGDESARYNGNGISFTPNRDVADDYASQNGGKGKVFEVNVTLKKPYYTLGVANFTPEEATEFTASLQAKGYDGIINYPSKAMREAGAHPNEVIVFDVKSATPTTVVCPVCGKAELPNYHSQDVVCPQCNSDLSEFRHIDQLSDEEKQELSDKFKGEDNQGNPIDHLGKLIVEEVKSVDGITDTDFMNPSRTVGLPALPEIVQHVLSTEGKSVIIKKNIFERNAMRHNELTPEMSRAILREALYNPTLYGKNKPLSRPNNWIVINVPDGKGNNKLVVLEVNDNKDNVEIVHWHEVDERGLKKIKRQAEREDGQLLILPSEKMEEAGALSGPTFNSPSDDKGNALSENTQAESRKNVTERSENSSKEQADKKKGTDSSDGFAAKSTAPITPIALSDNLNSYSDGKGNTLSENTQAERRKNVTERSENSSKEQADKKKGVSLKSETESDKTKKPKENETETDIQSRSGSAERDGGHEHQPNEPLGESQRNATEGSDRRGVDKRGVVDSLSDQERGRGVSRLAESKSTIGHSAVSEGKNVRNNHAERGVDYAPKGEDARIKANIEAIELAKRLLDAGEAATPEQMAVLRKFSGWGGLGKAFDDKGESPTSKRLRALLGEKGYQDAVDSRRSAYYTPANVIDAMWDVARALGFKGGNILEGSAGIGNILGLMPAEMSERSSIHAVEIDSTTGGILSLLYPDAQVEIQGFEKTKVRNNSVDLAITNVPFITGARVFDETGDKDLSKKFRDIHDFCIAKNIRKLREGGLGIFITSSGTMDNSKELRRWIGNEGNADVVGAFRMHNKTFGGTGATSDIIVVRKRVNGKPSPNAIDVTDVTGVRVADYDTGETRMSKGQLIPIVKQLPMTYNKYFAEHPECMAGEMMFNFERGETRFPTSSALFPSSGKPQEKMLSEWARKFATMKEEKPTRKVEDEAIRINEKLGEGTKEGSMVLNSKGELCMARMGEAVPIGLNKNKVKGHTKAECFEDYTAIKKALSDVLEYQSTNDDNAGLEPLLKELNRAFDAFTKKYGNLHKNTAISFLRNDVDFSSILALETYSEKGDKNGNKVVSVGKTDVFSRRVVETEKELQPTTVKDGILASLYKSGGIDVEYISETLGMTADDVKREIVKSGLGYENPSSGLMEVSYQYLSGNVREKLHVAQENNENGKYDANIAALEKVLPMTIPAHLIEFSLGSSWIEPKLYEDFVKEKTGIQVTLTNVGGTWFMKTPWSTFNEKNRAMAVTSTMCGKTIMGHELIEAAITNRQITVSKQVKRYNGATETITDKAATAECSTKIDEIRSEFKDWARERMQSDAEMSARIEQTYNDQFNNYVPMSIPDEFVPQHFGGQVSELHGQQFALRPHQGKAVVRGTTEPILLAHEVGTGKTYTLITTAMEMRRLGTARKPMIVVQNATVGQFVASAKEIYPNAKVLTIEEADRSADGRKNFYAKIKYNDWDMIVVPQSVFERIPDSPEREMAYIQDIIEEKMKVLEAMREVDGAGRSMIVRQAEKELEAQRDRIAELTEIIQEKQKKRDGKREATSRQNAEVRAMEMLDREVDDVENFDEMGIDAILVDEAHEYKHLGFATAMQRGVKGIDPSYSKKSQGVYLKTQSVMERNNGRNVVFATGTPISNTAAEIWTFMRYLMPADQMKAYGIYYFDDFVRNFGNLAQMVEFKTNGKFAEVNRFAGYVNLPELVRLWSSVADTVLTREAGGVKDKIPEMEGGAPQDIYLPQTRALRSVMKYVKSELDKYENMTGKEKKENSHIPLTMYGIAKAAAVDARLVIPNAEDDPNSKTNATVRETLRSLKESAKYKGTVAIFSDNYQNKRSGFNLYEDIRNKLIAEGIPADQIVVMKSGMSVKKKLEIFDKVNSGEVRVILGSTFTLGTGVNIQERLHTLIHVDAPNRPMDYTQRNGRALRQGNLHKDMGIPVRIIRFGVEDSLDVTAYQRLKTKGAIADSIMNGSKLMQNSMENRVLEEEEDSFGDMTAQLSGSEYAILKNQAEREVRNLTAKQKGHDIDQIYVHNQLPKVEDLIKGAKRRIEVETKNLETIGRHFPDGTIKKITVGKLSFDSLADMEDFFKKQNAKMNEAAESIREGSDNWTSRLTIDVDGVSFEVTTTVSREVDNIGQGTLSFEPERKVTYSCGALGIKERAVKGNRLKNVMQEIAERVVTGAESRELLARGQSQLARYSEDYRQLQERNGKEFPFKQQLAEAKERLSHYEEAMKKELAEKEAKYAEMDKSVDDAIDISLTEEDEDGVEYRTPEEGIAYINARAIQPWAERLEALRHKRDDMGLSLSEGERRELRELGSREKAWEERWVEEHGETYVKTGRMSRFDFYENQYGQGGLSAEINRARGEVGSLRDDNGRLISAHARDLARRALPAIERRREQLLTDRENYSAKGQEAIDSELAELEYMKLYYERMEAGEDVERTMPSRIEHQRMLATGRELASSLGEQIVLHENPSDIEDSDYNRKIRKQRSYGWYDPNDGTIHVNVGLHQSTDEIARTVLHELIGHKSIENIMGKQRFNRMIDEVWKHAGKKVRGKIAEKMGKHNWDFRKATKEYLAELAEDVNNKGFEHLEREQKSFWQRVKAKIQDFLNRILEGLSIPAKIKLTENDLSYMMWKLFKHQQRKTAGKPAEGDIFDRAEEIARREKWNRSGESLSIVARDGGDNMSMADRARAIINQKSIEIESHDYGKTELKEIYSQLRPVYKDGREIVFYNSAFGKNYRPDGNFAKVIPQLSELLEHSQFAYSEPDKLGGTQRIDGTSHRPHPNVKSFDNYVAKAKIGSQEYFVRMTIQNQQGNSASGVHSSMVTNVELYENPAKLNSLPTIRGGAVNYDRITDAKLRESSENAKKNPAKLNSLPTIHGGAVNYDRITDAKLREFFENAKKNPENLSDYMREPEPSGNGGDMDISYRAKEDMDGNIGLERPTNLPSGVSEIRAGGESIVGIEKLSERAQQKLGKYLEKYHSAPMIVLSEEADIEALPYPADVKEQMLNVFRNLENGAAYNHYDKKVCIFADRFENDDHKEYTLNHENIHRAIAPIDEEAVPMLTSIRDRILDSGYNNEQLSTLSVKIAEDYPEEKQPEEFMAYMLPWALRKPERVNQILSLLDDRQREFIQTTILNFLYNGQLVREATLQMAGRVRTPRRGDNVYPVRREAPSDGGVEEAERRGSPGDSSQHSVSGSGRGGGPDRFIDSDKHLLYNGQPEREAKDQMAGGSTFFPYRRLSDKIDGRGGSSTMGRSGEAQERRGSGDSSQHSVSGYGRGGGPDRFIDPERQNSIGDRREGNAEVYAAAKGLVESAGLLVVEISDAEAQAMFELTNKSESGTTATDNGEAARYSIETYHGTGADFDSFDFSHMGAGEGNQAFGWGGYVTGVKGIGQYYAKATSNKPLLDGKPFDHSQKSETFPSQSIEYTLARNYGDVEAAIKWYDEMQAQWDSIPRGEKTRQPVFGVAAEWLRENGHRISMPTKHLYTVAIPEDNGRNYIDWDVKADREVVRSWMCRAMILQAPANRHLKLLKNGLRITLSVFIKVPTALEIPLTIPYQMMP